MQRYGGKLRYYGGRRFDDFRLYDDLRQLASIFSAVALCCFAFSTIIGWGLYGSRFVEFLFRTSKAVRPFLVIYSFVAILGATVNLDLLWNIADTFNGLMSIPNLIALLLLSGTVVKLTKDFFAKEDGRKLKK